MSGSEAQRAQHCVTCALWLSRQSFLEGVRQSGRASFVPLFVHRELVGKDFVSGGERVFPEFLDALLREMRRLEIASSRAEAWPGFSGGSEWCTHVDRLFAHVCEERFLALPAMQWK